MLLMAVFAGGSAGGVAGQLPWGDIGQIGGQVAGGLAGGIAWALWLFMAAGRSPHAEASSSTRQRTGREQQDLREFMRNVTSVYGARKKGMSHGLE